ncbi:17387_t:CDS:2, partial [Cetraspora pellucida]
IYTITGITYYSFREACIALNLLQEDEEDTDIQNRALLYLQSILSKHKRCLEKFLYMPIPIADTNTEQYNYLIRKEQQYNIKKLAEIIKKKLLHLNVDQQTIFDEVIAAIETETSAVFL